MKKSDFRIWLRSSPLTKTIALIMVFLGLGSFFPGQAKAISVPTYTITDLGVLPGGTNSYAYGINNTGQVVGDSEVTPVGVVTTHAFLYENAVMKDLGTLGGRFSYARGINNTGQVAGYAEPTSNVTHAFRYSNGTMTDLGALPGANHSEGYAINNNGQVTGTAMVPASGLWPYHTFLYSDSGPMTDLGSVPTSGYGESRGFGINDNGWVVGKANPPGGGGGHAFYYDGTTMTDIGAAIEKYGYYSEFRGINNAGQMVGNLDPLGNSIAFSYKGGQAIALGSLGGRSVAMGLNSSGQVVGYSVTRYGYTHPFLYTKGRMVDLTRLVVGENPFAQLQVANAINDNGYIVGYGTMPDGSTHAFLATPGSRQIALGYVPYLLLLD